MKNDSTGRSEQEATVQQPLTATPEGGNGGSPQQVTSPRNSGLSTWLIVLIVGICLIVPGIGVFSALAIHGVRRYVYAAKTSEAKATIGALVRDVARCREAQGGQLPPSSRAVPSAPPAGKKVQTSPADWNDETFKCAGFQLTDPQYYQYQWVLEDPYQGYAEARGDLDGDGMFSSFRLRLQCRENGCTPALQIEENDPME